MSDATGPILAHLLTPPLSAIAIVVLGRLAPAAAVSPDKLAELDRRYAGLKRVANGLSLVGGFIALFVFVASHKNTPSGVGIIFGAITAFPITFLAMTTLGYGRGPWDEFWLYYGAKYKVSARLLLRCYFFLMAFGLLSVAEWHACPTSPDFRTAQSENR